MEKLRGVVGGYWKMERRRTQEEGQVGILEEGIIRMDWPDLLV